MYVKYMDVDCSLVSFIYFCTYLNPFMVSRQISASGYGVFLMLQANQLCVPFKIFLHLSRGP